MRRHALLFLGLAACAPVSISADAGGEPSKYDALLVEPVAGTATEATALDAPTMLDALGLDSRSRLVVAGEGKVAIFDGEKFVAVRFAANAGETVAFAGPTTIAARLAGGAWVGAQSGLFMLEGDYVTRTGILEPSAVTAVVEVETGPFAGLLLASPTGLYRRTATETSRIEVEGLGVDCTSVAVSDDGTQALAVFGDTLVRLSFDGAALVADVCPVNVGAVHALAAGPGVVAAATAQGVVFFRDGRWTHAPLALGAAVEATSLAIDTAGTLFARTANGVVRIEGEVLTRFVLGGARLVVDATGTLWSADGASLRRLNFGAPSPGFAAVLQPWLATQCVSCHADFTNHAAFSPRAEDALARVKRGDMPRCTGGLVCTPEQQLTPAQFAVLEQWIEGGKRP